MTLARSLLSSLWCISRLFCSFSVIIFLSWWICCLCLGFSRDWSWWRSLGIFWFDLIIDDNSDFLNFTIMYFLNDFYFIYPALFIHYILLHNYDLICMSKSSGYLLLDMLISMLGYKST